MASVASVARASRVTVAAAVNRVSFDGCYRDALVSLGRAEGGAGTAHLEIDEDGIITSAQVRLPGALSPAASCFAGKLRGQRVNVPDTGAAAADISFTLVPN